jgi:hypothetical protein
VLGWIRLAAVAGAAALLTGCGASHEVIRVTPEQRMELNASVPGKSRVRLRSGATMAAHGVELHRGRATWRSVPGDRELSASMDEIDSLQLKNTGRGVGRGLGIGLMAGFFLGFVGEASNGTQNGFFDEDDRRVLAGAGLGVVGAVLGGIAGAIGGVWEDRYRFVVAEPEDSP